MSTNNNKPKRFLPKKKVNAFIVNDSVCMLYSEVNERSALFYFHNIYFSSWLDMFRQIQIQEIPKKKKGQSS